MDVIYLGLVLLSLILYSLLPFFWLARHMVRMRYGSWFGLDIMIVLVFMMLGAVVFTIFEPFINTYQVLPTFAVPLGWLVIAACIAIELWSLYLLGQKVEIGKGVSTKLVSSGPYSLVRHPIYICHTFINLGIYLVIGALIPLFVFAEWLLMIKPLADFEDEELALRLEEAYLKYKKKVPQLVPKIK